jgi:alpha-amylase/alpha-mannosidase (GH57 family)
MDRYICVHGHFYQPPRENSWLEAIEAQDSAYPYHDWNERITVECYAPNAASRILDGEGRIVQIVNNYARISFNFGPTLLAWLEASAPEVYDAVLAADQESRGAFSGHGSALAQAYNHMIEPLANRRDKYTQVLWGIRDFEHRFGREPEGMWLPETAVDLETLDILAELGIQFTILAPHQASRVRRIGGRSWRDVSGGRIDPRRAYMVRLPSGRRINLFFYDDPISRAVAFEGLLSSGEQFSERLVRGFTEDRPQPQLVHIATDGETYGHHHRHGDMALAYALHYIQSNGLAQLTNYGEYLERHPPGHEVEIFDNTSWSCPHGVERWRSDCGCNTGGRPGWNQAWRTPLREALDWLRDVLADQYEQHARQFLSDPWEARDDYIDVILDRSPKSLERFLSQHAARELSEDEKVTVLKLLELQRHAMLMYTSCGWFFDEVSGIETVQVIQYAGRAIQLAQDLFGDTLETRFLKRLESARGNIPEHQDGRRIYEEFVKPAVLDLRKVGAHYAVSSLFEPYGERAKVYCYTAHLEDHQSSEAGEVKLAVGRARITSDITRESALLTFGVLHFGDHNLSGGVRDFLGDEAYRALLAEMTETFSRADYPELVRFLDKHFGASTYSLKSLFRDEQRNVLTRILESTLAEAEAVYRELYEHHAPLMRFLTYLRIPLPRAFRTAAEVVLSADLRWAFEEEEPDLDRVRAHLEAVTLWRIDLDTEGLSYALRRTMERLADRFRAEPSDLANLQRLDTIVSLARFLPFEVDLWKAQNTYYEVLHTEHPAFFREMSEQGDESASTWVSHFLTLGEKLLVRVG